MGIYFKKSVNVGLLRFNFSKSGIGVSTGLPGLRIGTGPRGNYVHVGTHGLYYRGSLPSGSYRPPTGNSSRSNGASSRGRLTEIESEIVSSPSRLIDELNEKRRLFAFGPLIVALSAITIGWLVEFHVAKWITGCVGIMLTLFSVATFWMDQVRKSSVLQYELSSTMEEALDQLHSCLTNIGESDGIWQIRARGRVYDPRYHAGGSQLVDRNRISIMDLHPPRMAVNVNTPAIQLRGLTLYFFPDRILVFSKGGVEAVDYGDLTITATRTKFIEEGIVPADTEVVDQTWQFVNNDGGPDRRFRDNRPLPICQYEEIWLNSESGLNEVLQVSRTGMGKELDTAIQKIAELISVATQFRPELPVETIAKPEMDSAPRAPALPTPPPPTPTPKFEPSRVFQCLFEILCCMMVADGRVSSPEKKCIQKIMDKVQSNWTSERIDEQLQEFMRRVKQLGYEQVLNSALSETDIFKKLHKEPVLFRALDLVASADGEMSDREFLLSQRIRRLLEESPS